MLRRLAAASSSRAVTASLRSCVRSTAPLKTASFIPITRHSSASAVFTSIKRTFATKKDTDDKETKSSSSSGGATVAATASDFSSIVSANGGWWAFLGLGAYLLFSKEILLLNEEFLMVSNFATMIAISYFAVGDSALEAVEADKKEEMRKADLVSDLQIDLIQAQIKAHEINIAQVDVIKAFKHQYASLANDVVKARTMRARQAAYDAAMSKLNSLRQRQEGEAQQYLTTVFDYARQHVEEEWEAADADTKHRYLQWAIEAVGGSNKPLENDPITTTYKAYLESGQYARDIEADKEGYEEDEFDEEDEDDQDEKAVHRA